MKKRTSEKLKRTAALFLCASLFVCMTGCGGSNASEGDASGTSSAEIQDEVPTDTGEAEAAGAGIDTRIDDNGKPIYDFDEFVNGEWLNERAEAGDGIVSHYQEEEVLIRERIKDILENTDISELSEDDGLYKTVSVYRELNDPDNISSRMNEIRDILSVIDRAGSLDDLYKLYGDERYSIYNTFLNCYVDADDGGYNVVYLNPYSRKDTLEYMRELVADPEGKGRHFLLYMNELGYSGEKVSDIVDNAIRVADIFESWHQAHNDGYWYYYRPGYFEENSVGIPVFEILRKLNCMQGDEEFYSCNDIADELNTLFAAENVSGLRDHLLLCAADRLYSVSGYGIITENPNYDMAGCAYQIVSGLSNDILAQEYMNRYVDEGIYEEVEDLFEEVKSAALSVMTENDWLSVHGQEKVKSKFIHMQCCIGSNRYANDLSDLTITGNTVEDYVNLTLSDVRHSFEQTAYEDNDRGPYRTDMLVANAWYMSSYNAFVLCAGLLGDPKCSPDAAYEERLGFAGWVIAHELSHSLDPSGICYNSKGWYEPWLNEDEQAAYDEHLERIRAFFDGKDGGYRRTINGSNVLKETFADILAMNICLKLLAEREDADYDLFFRTLARQNAMYLTEETVDYYVDDCHLPGKVRTDYIFGQFDVFYEIYDIDENSPYYVKEQFRLEDFWK